jgi:molybdate transport system regulatory protein
VESQGDMLHAIITNTSLKDMDIRRGDEVTAIVKSTELILSKDM